MIYSGAISENFILCLQSYVLSDHSTPPRSLASLRAADTEV